MKRFAHYQAAVDYLLLHLPMFTRIGAAALKPSLDNIERLLQHLGNPHLQYKIIHVAGTNGKGTVSHLIAAMLQSQGLKVGLHTSPHYNDLGERMKVDGRLPDQNFILDFMNEHIQFIESLNPSFFEITVAMSFEYFAKEKVDYAVIEVGLGGRLDSTNVVKPLLSIITNISLDHTDLLGNTTAEIAVEKAGIIKNNTLVLIGERQIETTPVFTQIAVEKDAEIYFADELVVIKIRFQDLEHTDFEVDLPNHHWKISIDISGPFQENNFKTAFAALHLLEKNGFKWDVAKLKSFLKSFRKNVHYLGRWHVIHHHPLILVDSAHNAGGMAYILESIKNLTLNQLHIVIGFAADKKRAEIYQGLPKNAQYYFTKASIPRALDPEILMNEAMLFGLSGSAYYSVNEALDAAKLAASIDDLIFVGGSIFVVAEVV